MLLLFLAVVFHVLLLRSAYILLLLLLSTAFAERGMKLLPLALAPVVLMLWLLL